MPRSPDYYDDWREVLTELKAQTDRGVAVVGLALLDAKIGKALRLIFVPGLSQHELDDLFDGPVAPLGSFSAKVRVAHALGLIGDESKADLRLLGQIRNKFAHRLEIRSFENPTILKLCGDLSLADRVFESQERPVEARARFIQSVINIMHFLYSELVAGTKIGAKPSKSP